MFNIVLIFCWFYAKNSIDDSYNSKYIFKVYLHIPNKLTNNNNNS